MPTRPASMLVGLESPVITCAARQPRLTGHRVFTPTKRQGGQRPGHSQAALEQQPSP